jgi:hypothetical protein
MEMIEREMGAVRDALRASSAEQIGGAVARLQATTDHLALGLQRSAGAFEDASRNLAAYAAAPTFFYWLTQVAIPRLLGRRRRRSSGSSTRSVSAQRARSTPLAAPASDPAHAGRVARTAEQGSTTTTESARNG